jgi:hypothetical protein
LRQERFDPAISIPSYFNLAKIPFAGN